MHTDPAEQRRILRRTLERALRQHTAIKPAAAPALTAAVWRVVEPQLAQRDAQLEAVRALHHEWTDGAPGCCAHCQDGMGTPLPWPCPTICALGTRPDARPTAGPDELLVRVLSHYVPACPSGRHAAHPAYTCDEQDQAALAWDKFVADSLGAALAGRNVATVPPPLRGPAWAHPADSSPLRDLAARTIEEQHRRDLPARAARIAAHLTEQLIPADLRTAGIHLAYDTPTKENQP